MLIASRNIVVSSSRLGKAENSSALPRYIDATTIISPPEMFRVMKKSSIVGGSGMISIVTTVTTATAAIRSVRARILSSIPSLAVSAITASPQNCLCSRSYGHPLPCSHSIDEGQHLRDGRVQVGRDHLVHLDDAVELTRQRRIGNQRHA